MERLPSLSDDGLITPDVGPWAEDKYQLVRCYATIFANAMHKKWPSLVYVDLFAGAGRSILRDTNRIVAASPLLVLDIPHPFSRYVFVELDDEKAAALRQRVDVAGPTTNATVLNLNANEAVDEVLKHVPNGALLFCFADPYNIEALRFETLKRIARRSKTDFLVLLASGMDAHRNAEKYLATGDDVIAAFSGAADWRSRWPHERLGFGDFVADEFGSSMRSLGYLYDGLAGTKEITNSKKALLYRLAFFSKHPLGSKFWDQCRKYASPQRALF